MSSLAGRRGLAVVIGAYLLLATAYSVVVPLGEAPDEVSHYSFARHVAREGRLPQAEGAASGEAFQPPLYYAVGAAISAWIPEGQFTVKGNSDYSLAVVDAVPNVLLHTAQEGFPYRGGALAWHLLRLASVLMGAVTVWATYGLATQVLPRRQDLALAAAAFIAFLPEFLFISGSVNNDNLATLLSSLTLLQLARLWRGEPGKDLLDGGVASIDAPAPAGRARKQSAAWLYLGLLLGLGFWTKLSLLVFWPLAVLVLLRLAMAGRQGWAASRELAGTAAVTFVPAVAISLPLAIRNVGAFGDPLGWGLMRQVTEAVAGPLALGDYATWLTQLFQSFWGRFGGAAHVQMHPLVYAGLVVVTGLALLGDIRLLLRSRKETAFAGDSGPEGQPSRGLVALLGVHCLLVAGLLWQWAHTNQGTGQARLAYPALPAIGLFFVTGLVESAAALRSWVKPYFSRWMGRRDEGRGRPRWHAGIALVVAGGMLALGFLTLFGYLLPLYHFQPRLSAGEVPPSVRHGPFAFGSQIRLLGWEIEKTTLAPGETGYVVLYWQAVSAPPEDYWLLLRLQGAGDRTVWDKDGSPSAGRDSTDTWKGNGVIAARHRIALSGQTPPGTYRLLAGLHRFGAWDWLMIQDASGRILGDTIALGEVTVAAR